MIHLTLNTLGGKTWEEAQRNLASAMSLEYDRRRYLLGGDFLDDDERGMYRRLRMAAPAI